MNFLNRLLSLIILLATALVAPAASVKLSVRPARGNSIGVGDTFYLIYSVENVDATPAEPSSIPGGQVMFFTLSSQGSSIRSVNGHQSRSTFAEYTATVKATKAGSYKFGPVSVGGVRSNAVSYTIGSSSSSGNNTPPSSMSPDPQNTSSGPKFIGKGDQSLFMRASVSKTRAYEQEALVYTVKLYSASTRISFVGATAAPKFEGFVIEESPVRDAQLRMENYGGKTYATAVIAKYIIFPQMKGKLNILGNKYTVSVAREDLYSDPYFGSISVGQPVQVSVAPNDLSIEVLPLPEPRPANFSGGVGSFNISAAMPSTDLKTGQTASIVYTVTGQGNLKYVALPELSTIFPSQIEVYSPQTDVKAQVSGDNVSGSVRFDYSLMPSQTGTFQIPPLQLVYFNPQTGKYETATAKGFTVNVAKGNESANSQTKKHVTFHADLMPVGSLSHVHEPYVYKFTYWLFYIVPVVLLLIAIIIWRRRLKEYANMAALMSRRAGKFAEKRLKKAKMYLKKEDSEHFYDEMLASLWGYLSNKLGMPASELNRENVSQQLQLRGVSESLINSTIYLLDECEFSKYSSNRGSSSMQTIYRDGVQVIEDLEDYFKKYKSTAMPTSKTTAIIVILMICSSMHALAASPLQTADSAYRAGDYQRAIDSYSQVIKQEGTNAALLFNLGNAYVKAGDFGRAMLNYQRARRLDPSDDAINDNIQWLENKVYDQNRLEVKENGIDIKEDDISFFQGLHHRIVIDTASDSWAAMAAVAFILAIGFLALYIFSGNVLMRKTGFFSCGAFLLIAVLFVIFSFGSASHMNDDKYGVIIAEKTELFDKPDADSQPVKPMLNPGTRLEILEQRKSADSSTHWYRVRLNSKVTGWIHSKNFETI